MLYEWVRVLKYDGTTFTDLSIDNQNEDGKLNLALTTTDFIYIGQYFPFNNLFFWMDTFNSADSSIILEYWSGRGNDWVPFVDVLDGTQVGTSSMARPGTIQYTPDKQEGWISVAEPDKASGPTEMQTAELKIYDLYWMRLSFSENITVGTQANQIAYAFTSTSRLNNLDIEIDSFFEAFESGKTDWIREILTASELVVSDFKRQGIINTYGNFLRFDDISLATEMKALEIIYMNLGSSYQERKVEIRNLYSQAIKSRRLSIDTNNDGQVDSREIFGRTRAGVR